jgi:putative flippase GtrA
MQLFKFILVGLINTLFGYGIFAVLILVDVNFVLSALLSTIIGILFNFKTISRFVFGSNDNYLIYKFVVSYLVLYLINITSLYVLNIFGVDYLFGGLVLTIPIAILSFCFNKFFVFRSTES